MKKDAATSNADDADKADKAMDFFICNTGSLIPDATVRRAHADGKGENALKEKRIGGGRQAFRFYKFT